MPTHIDIRTGRWLPAVDTSLKAVAADQEYETTFGQPQSFLSLYIAHNRHTLAYAAMMTGQRDLAMRHIRAMVAELPADFLRENSLTSEAFVALPMEVMVRFARWDDILAETDKYPDYMTFTRAFHCAARAVAFAAKGDTESAREEQAVFRDRAQLVRRGTTVGNNSARAILALVQSMLEGEILIAERELDDGLGYLRAAVKLEDALNYDEPPSWMIPVRHSLGANLMKAGRFAEAEEVYREDLRRLPGNGWSLYGLAESLGRQHKNPSEADAIYARFQKIWAKSDLRIGSSCLCQPKI